MSDQASTAARGRESAGQQTAPRPIRSAYELFETLTAPDPASRFDALRAIQARPEAALAFGIYGGEDVIDILLRQAKSMEGTLEWTSWIGVLAGFCDARITEFFVTVLATEEAAQLIFTAARYLSGCDLTPYWSRLGPLPLQNENPTRARAAVSLLRDAPSLSPAARLRIALLCSEATAQAPVLDRTTAALWLDELAGPFRMEARSRLKAQGDLAWATLAMEWKSLDESNRLWLLEWGANDCCAMVAGLLPEALRSGSRNLRLEALGVLAALRKRATPEPVGVLALDFLDNPDPEIRAAAVLASPAGPDWRAFLSGETVPAVRRACVRQLAWTEGTAAIPDLIGLLRSDDWQVRAVSAEALVDLGMSAAEAVKPLVHDEDQKVRIAAMRVLLDLRQDSWLEREFHSFSS